LYAIRAYAIPDAVSRANGAESFDRQRQISLDLDYLEDIVETRLKSAAEKVVRALAFDERTAHERTALERAELVGHARADYSVAHIVASLVDARCYDANEWPVFTTWARDLMQAVGGVD
jgi:hypothetical protein